MPQAQAGVGIQGHSICSCSALHHRLTLLEFRDALWPIASSPSERRQSCRAVVNNAKLGITGRRVLSRASWGVLGPREAIEALE